MQTITQTTVAQMVANVEVENLTSWDLYFRRYSGYGDVLIKAQSRFASLVDYPELCEQIRNRNIMFVGTDGYGSHARVRIVDDEVRRALLGVESDNAILLTKDTVTALLAIKDKDAFAARLKTLVVTDAECRMIVELVKDVIDEKPGYMRDAITAVTGETVMMR